MTLHRRFPRCLVSVALLVLLALPAAASELFQAGAFAPFAEGAFGGFLPCSALTRHGDTGLGTFDHLDGELILLDGTVYRAAVDGTLRTVPEKTLTPFAQATFLPAREIPLPLGPAASLEDLLARLEELRPDGGSLVVFRVEGTFDSLRFRSVPPQPQPYPTLEQAVKTQRVHETGPCRATLVGVWSPSTFRGVGVPGPHFHVATQDRTRGGHLLGCVLREGTVRLAVCHTLVLRTAPLPKIPGKGGTAGSWE